MSAEQYVEGDWRSFDAPAGYEPQLTPIDRLPSEVVKEAAGATWQVLKVLALKPCPYIVKAYDTPGGTDYNSDYSWHALDKEKLFELPGKDMLGLVNPNSDIYFAFGFGVGCQKVKYDLRFRPVVHLADLLIYRVDLDEEIECEVLFRCARSDTVVSAVVLRNPSNEDQLVNVGNLFGKEPLDNPPHQRYLLPQTRHGSGVTTTAGGIAWMGAVGGNRAALVCFYDWAKGKCEGRRLLATVLEVVGEHYEPAFSDRHTPPPGTLAGDRTVVVPARGTAIFAQALNLRRFATQDVENPILMPLLYKRETEEQAAQEGYKACVEVLAEDWQEVIRCSVEPYRTFPKISIPEKSWEADFYASLELPRASTFSPYGLLKQPFYNFCRVHAHEPFGWWTYGMHAHENLCVLVNNIVHPNLSQDYLKGHISQQRPDGMYPYGVNHAGTDPYHKPETATAPLIVWESWNVYLWSGDREFLCEAYESGKRNHEWWIANRSSRGDGICRWRDTSVESVRDDDHLTTWQATGGSQHQDALDLNCYLLVQERTLAAMAAELGFDDEATHFARMADQRACTMNERMWHAGDSVYYGIGDQPGQFVRVKDISTFFPLWAELATESRFERIASIVTDPETFGTPYGPPVLAANEPGFGPESHWFGANWVEMSMLVIIGLRNYGYYRLAADLAYRNTKMVFDELERHGHFREYFNSVTGSGTGLVDYIWTSIPAYFIVGVFLGIEPVPAGIRIIPALPQGWNNLEVRNLHVREKHLIVKIAVREGLNETISTVNGQPVEAFRSRGVFIPWTTPTNELRIEITQPPVIPEQHTAPVRL
ncbi:MAG: MGH1-like glycoside hydrolase domain-containing protein [Armatimonadota bacterium]